MGRPKGWHHTEEEKRKIGLASKCIGISSETRAKMVASRRANGNYVFSEEHRRRLSEARRKRVITAETRSKIGAKTKGHKYAFGYRHTEETKRLMSQQRIGNKHMVGYHIPDEVKAKISDRIKAVWAQSIEYKNERVGNIVRGNKKKPNDKELTILDMLEEIQPNIWRFIGDGKDGRVKINAIAGKMPDIWNGNHKIIEHYGAYWHRNHNPQERIDLFARHGYNALIIQEMELIGNPDKVKEKIREFVDAT